jgi:hypothetical protein
MKVKVVNACHPDYDGDTLQRYSLIYRGGKDFLRSAAMFMPKRHMEPNQVYAERLRRAYYIGYVGPIIYFFISNLFNIDASIKSDPEKVDKFYGNFFKNFDRKNTEFNNFFRKVFTQTIIHKESFILVDYLLEMVKQQLRLRVSQMKIG